MPGDVLSLRALNRATLDRQLLLRRSGRPVLATVEHLVGLQAQIPLNPYTALWSRLDGFRPEELAALLVDRQVVRIVVMRGTLHLVTADDCLLLRPLVQPILEREMARHGEHGGTLRGADLEPVTAFARELLGRRPHTGAELRAALAERFPGADAAALAFACRNRLALVQVPPRGLWGRSGQVTTTTAESWLERPLAIDPPVDEVVVRYLRAFGPATTADVAAWSGLTGMREVVERLRPRLRAFRDERGRELLDLPDAPRPHADTPAPPRFLPEYDNVLLSHADRSRFATDEDRRRLLASDAPPVRGSVLVDGSLGATWSIERSGPSAGGTVVVRHVGRLTTALREALASEGLDLVRFLDAGAGVGDVRFVQVD